MRLLFLGDVMGRSGRSAVAAELPRLRRQWRLDFVVVNGENATGGVGLSAAHAKLLLDAGADCLTLGDHAFDQREMLSFIEQEPRILRPINFARSAPGQGARFFDAPGGRRVFVAQVLGRVFMKQPFDDPFSAIDLALRPAVLGGTAAAVIVDVHAEATSEKMAMGHWCDGRASLVVGTHTHVPTSDYRILAHGTAYVSDAGMCGDYDSVLGMDKEEPIRRFLRKVPGARFEPATGSASLTGVAVETDDATGLARRIAPIRLGGVLSEARPDFWE
jgi:metallophosphoesterase (TIGR00282 family)